MTEEFHMNNVDEVLLAVSIGSIVALFLFTTSRIPKSIELLKECLVVLNNKLVYKQDILLNSFYEMTHGLIIEAYCRISDYQSAIKCCRELIVLHQECGNRAEEGKILIKMATMYYRQCKYGEAREIYEKALAFSKKIGDRRIEAESCSGLGIIYKIQGEYPKAEGYLKKALSISVETGDRQGEATAYGNLGTLFRSLGKYLKAKEYHEKALGINKEIGNSEGMAADYGNLGTVFECISEFAKAKECLEKALAIGREMRDRDFQAVNYTRLGTVLASLGEYVKAKESHNKALVIAKETGDKYTESASHVGLGNTFQYLGEYQKAAEHYEKALVIQKEIGHREGEASSYGNLGAIFQYLGEYDRAKVNHEKALVIRKEIGDKEGQAADYGNLGAVYHFLGENVKTKECIDRELVIRKEIGDRKGEASCYNSQGGFFLSRGEYLKANEYYEKVLLITKEIADRQGEASSYIGLGSVCSSRGEYVEAIAHHKKALKITKDIGYRRGEAECYKKLGIVFESLCEYDKAKEYYEKNLSIRKEIGDRKELASSFGSLGAVFCTLGEFLNANECHEKALAISKDIGDKDGEATSNANLGGLFYSLGEYDRAIKYLEKALTTKQDISERAGEASINRSLGAAFHHLGKYAKANEYQEKGLEIAKAIGDKKGEAEAYSNLGVLCRVIGKYNKAKEYHEKALAIREEFGDKEGEPISYGNLGSVYQYLGKRAEAEENFKKALTITQKIGNVPNQVPYLCKLAWLKFSDGKVQEAYTYLLSSIQKCEKMRGFLGSNDQLKISFSDKHDFPYWTLADMLCSTGNQNEALCVSELGRARALADLMASQYSVENQISANPQSWVGVERIITRESNCSCLYIAYFAGKLFLWVIKTSGVVHFRQTKVNENIGRSGEISNVDDFFTTNFRTFSILTKKDCEDRSLNEMQPTPKSSPEDSLTDVPSADDNKESQEGEPILALCYKLIIAPVAEFLTEPEIIIVPDGPLYKVPFAALSDESGKCLSETFRIRIVPSLTTLKLIQDSPADYHSQTGALIVGNPDVGRVRYRGKKTEISRLPCAGKEAEMIGQLLEVPPLLGEQATKEAVLERLNSVSLIHFAAHGDPDTGEIALAPKCTTAMKIPQEEDYLLKMSDISKVQLRAKLVVLSCCHSGRGRIRAEGVVGIARAFLGSGARSVLVALWALEDSATEQFMHRFYEYLVSRKSASECLHEAMKWMRGNGYSKATQWAPFMLMGDNVAFDFKREMEAELALHNSKVTS